MQAYLSGAEKRKSRRVEVLFDLVYKVGATPAVSVKVGDKDKYATTMDISEGGMAIMTDYSVPVLTELDITFHLIYKDHQTPPMSAIGRVCYISVAANRKGYRLGIEFIKIKDEDRKRIIDFVRARSSS